MEEATFFVNGVPMAKQSFQVTGPGKGFLPGRTKDWSEKVMLAARDWAIEHNHGPKDHDGFFTVELVFALPGKKEADVDNLSKAVLDGINGWIWKDDHQVVSLVVSKVRLMNDKSLVPGVFVRIRRISYYTPALLTTLVPDWPRR